MAFKSYTPNYNSLAQQQLLREAKAKEPELPRICNNCHWFRPIPCSDWFSMERENLGLYGNCIIKAPGDRGWPTTWGSMDCGEWTKRSRPPVVDPNPDWMKESIQKEKENYEKEQALASKGIS